MPQAAFGPRGSVLPGNDPSSGSGGQRDGSVWQLREEVLRSLKRRTGVRVFGVCSMRALENTLRGGLAALEEDTCQRL